MDVLLQSSTLTLSYTFYHIRREHLPKSFMKENRVPSIDKDDHRQQWQWWLVVVLLKFTLSLLFPILVPLMTTTEKLWQIAFIILLYHVLGRREVWREKELIHIPVCTGDGCYHCSCCCCCPKSEPHPWSFHRCSSISSEWKSVLLTSQLKNCTRGWQI